MVFLDVVMILHPPLKSLERLAGLRCPDHGCSVIETDLEHGIDDGWAEVQKLGARREGLAGDEEIAVVNIWEGLLELKDVV